MDGGWWMVDGGRWRGPGTEPSILFSGLRSFYHFAISPYLQRSRLLQTSIHRRSPTEIDNMWCDLVWFTIVDMVAREFKYWITARLGLTNWQQAIFFPYPPVFSPIVLMFVYCSADLIKRGTDEVVQSLLGGMTSGYERSGGGAGGAGGGTRKAAICWCRSGRKSIMGIFRISSSGHCFLLFWLNIRHSSLLSLAPAVPIAPASRILNKHKF